MKDVVVRILSSDLGPPGKLIAVAIAAGIPVTSEDTGLSTRSIERHLGAAQDFVRKFEVEAPALAPAPARPREKANPEAWLRAQEEDLRVVRAGVRRG